MKNEYKNIETSLIPYDQSEVETLLKQLMFQNGITDVMYEGSNVSQLASVISYAISTLNVNTAINLQETILPLATKRMNILFGARQLGYEPVHIKSYKYKLLIKPKHYTGPEVQILSDPSDLHSPKVVDTMNNNFAFAYKIEPYTEFKNGEKSYWYTGPTITINPDLGHIDKNNKKVLGMTNADVSSADLVSGHKEVFAEIEVIQGKLTRSSEDKELQIQAIDYMDEGIQKTRQDYLVPYVNVEDDEGITAYLTYIDKFGATQSRELWSKSKQILVDENLEYNKRKFVRMENIILGYPAIFFEFAGLGNGIRSKTIIEIDVLQSLGKDGQATGNFEVVDTRGSEIFEVKEYKMTQEGTNAESDASIKENALVFHNTANRAVTRLDYVAITQRHPTVKHADAWGGEEEEPKQKGEIWISATPELQNRLWKEKVTPTTQEYELDIGTLDKLPDNNKKAINHEKDSQQKNFQNWYLNKTDWEGFTNNMTGHHSDGLRDYLDTFKIMTMGLNYRHPLYVDFEFKMNIVKYDIHTNPAVTNKRVFDTLDNYFLHKIEAFDAEYMNSSLQRVLDQNIGFETGINYELHLYGVLCEEMIDTYWNTKSQQNQNPKERIIVNLAWPFEKLLPAGKDGDVNPDVLPRIDTANFSGTKALTVDYNDIKITPVPGQNRPSVREVDIKLGTKVIGTYRVDTNKNIIELDFDLSKATKDEFFGTATNGIRKYNRFNIVYSKSPNDSHTVNAPFAKNIIPRLKRVEFDF